MYSITEITTNDEIEQLGTKEKFWFYDTTGKKLFKVGRKNTGENWAEKVAYELATLLNLPCAKYNFAQWGDKIGTISTSFVPDDSGLVHGNELLMKLYKSINASYPKDQFYKVTAYKLSMVLYLLNKIDIQLPISFNNEPPIQTATDVFIGYLVFDCWISNQDRHHENWGIIWQPLKQLVFLAPTYDHASGLGCKVSEVVAENRLKTKDDGYSVRAYVNKAKTPFYSLDNKLLKTIQTVQLCFSKHQTVTTYWINKIESIKSEQLDAIFNNIPNHLIGKYQKKFASQLLMENKMRLESIITGNRHGQ